MQCHEMEGYLLDYIHNELRWLTRLRVRWHLLKCPACQSWLKKFQKLLNLLECDVLPEPPEETWKRMQGGVQKVLKIPSTRPPILVWRYAAVGFLLLVSAFLGWLIIPTPKTAQETNSSLFWTFFNSDLWDFSNFFQKVNNTKLTQMTIHIEKAVQTRLQQELELDKKDTSQLFPLLQSFGYKMKEYYDHYGTAMASLSNAIEKGEQGRLEKSLEEVQQIRQRWSESRWQFLTNVRFILNQKKFARFLIFTERLPQELYVICSQLCQNQS